MAVADRPARRERVLAAYGATLFLTSAGALVIEIVAGRMLAPYVGMSLYTWTAIIASSGFSAMSTSKDSAC